MKKLPLFFNLSAYLLRKQNQFISSIYRSDNQIVNAINHMTLDILRGQLNDSTERNLIFSPISVLITISILNYGLGDVNKAGIHLLGDLNLNNYQQYLHQFTGKLLKNLTNAINETSHTEFDVLTILQFANYLGISNRIEDELSLNYNALVNRYDFSRKDERNRALNETYRLIRQHTKNQLALGLQYLPRESSRLNLYSTVYLHTSWLDTFNPMHTFTDRFFNQNGKVKENVLFINRNTYANTSTLINRDLQFIELFLEDQLSIIIILSSQRYAFHEMLFNAKNDEIDSAIKRLSQKYINIRIPRFTVEHQTTIQELIKPLKINPSLDCKKSSLRRFSKGNRTCLDFNLLYTKMKIDEQGVNVLNQEGAFYGDQRIDSIAPKIFVQSPFAFIVKHRITGIYLLAGLINQF